MTYNGGEMMVGQGLSASFKVTARLWYLHDMQ